MHYSLLRVLSYNAFLNFLIGERGVGKTFSVTEFVTREFIKKSYEFVYIRRYKTELQKSSKSFFTALINEGKFKDHQLYSKGNNYYIDETQAGYGIPLTASQSMKSTNFSRVKYIIFDEFIIESGNNHYLKNEVEIFLGLVETIARLRDVKIFMLGNAVTEINPYFLYFNINIPYKNDIKLYKNGLILIQYMKNNEYREFKKQTKFGRLIEGTEFSKYAIDNEFREDNKLFIKKKSGAVKYSFALKYKDYIIGIWLDFNVGEIYASFDYIKNSIIFACTKEDHSPNTMLLSMAKKIRGFRLFIEGYKQGNLYFENNKIKSLCNEILRLIIIR